MKETPMSIWLCPTNKGEYDPSSWWYDWNKNGEGVEYIRKDYLSSTIPGLKKELERLFNLFIVSHPEIENKTELLHRIAKGCCDDNTPFLNHLIVQKYKEITD